MKCSPIGIACFVLLALGVTGCRTLEEDSGTPRRMTQADFAMADSDGDGKLTKKEAATHLHREALAEFDLDGDSQISLEEWAAARPSAGEDDPAFRKLDRDGNGQVEEAEAIEFLSENETFTETFDEVDGNGDGGLLWEEIEAGDPKALHVPLFPAPAQTGE